MKDKKIDQSKIERKLSKEDLERLEIIQKSEDRGAKKNEKGIRGSDGRMAYIEDLEEGITRILCGYIFVMRRIKFILAA